MRGVAAGLWSLTVALVALGTGLSVGRDRLSELVLYALLPLSLATIGALVVSQRSGNRIGWLFSLLGLWIATAEACEGYGLRFAGTGRLGAELGGWVVLWAWVAELATWAAVAAIFPNGHLAGRGWRWVPWVAGVGFVTAAVGYALAPSEQTYGRQNPLEVDHPLVEACRIGGSVLLLVALAGAVASLVLRLRRSRGVERQQLKWFALATGIVAVIAPVVTTLWLVAPVVAPVLGAVAFNLVPLAAGIAILRYRLYDIDLVINRTLVYGALTAMLVATYLVSVLLFRLALAPFTGESELAVAASTLAVAGLFRPLRSRIQAVVDRRFYRSRYDAARTLERFAGRLRHELDIDTLGTTLRAVVGETMQPEHVTLWVRPTGPRS